MATGNIKVNALVNGVITPMSLNLSMTTGGVTTPTGTYALPLTMAGFTVGTYTLNYKGGANMSLILTGISPNATQAITAGGTTTWNINFRTAVGSINLTYLIDGNPAPSGIAASLKMIDAMGKMVTLTNIKAGVFPNIATGTYNLTYLSGMPAGVQGMDVNGISFTITDGTTTNVILNFKTITGAIKVQIFVDGQPVSSTANLMLTNVDTGITLPTWTGNVPATGLIVPMPAGNYRLDYAGGI